jgi:hypothetical protein
VPDNGGQSSALSFADLGTIIDGGEYSVEVLDCGDFATAVFVEGA